MSDVVKRQTNIAAVVNLIGTLVYRDKDGKVIKTAEFASCIKKLDAAMPGCVDKLEAAATLAAGPVRIPRIVCAPKKSAALEDSHGLDV